MELLLNIVIACIAVPAAWFQVHRLRKVRTSQGLSSTFVGLSLCASFSWITYGACVGEPLQLVVNGSGGVANAVALALIIRYVPSTWRVGAAVVVFAGAASLGALLFGPAVFGMAGAMTGIGCLVPQVLKSWKEPGGVAVSVPRFLMSASSGSLWTVYGAAHHDWFVILSSVLSVSSSIFIVVRAKQPQRLVEEDLAIAPAA